MRFYDLAAPEHLLQRLVLDCAKPNLCEALSQLLLSNFYPQEVSTAERDDGGRAVTVNSLQLSRCLKLIQQDVRSAVVFYSSLYKHVSIASTTKFAVNLFVSLSSEMEEVCTTIDSVLSGVCTTDAESKYNVLMKSLVPTLDIPIGMLEIVLSIVLSLQDQLLYLSTSGAGSNPTVVLFNKYFSTTELVKMSQLLDKCMISLFYAKIGSTSSVSCGQHQAGVLSKLAILQSLHLQLLSVSATISPSFSQDTAQKSSRKKGNSASCGSAASIYKVMTKMLNFVFHSLGNVPEHASVLNKLLISSVEAICVIKYQVISYYFFVIIFIFYAVLYSMWCFCIYCRIHF